MLAVWHNVARRRFDLLWNLHMSLQAIYMMLLHFLPQLRDLHTQLRDLHTNGFLPQLRGLHSSLYQILNLIEPRTTRLPINDSHG